MPLRLLSFLLLFGVLFTACDKGDDDHCYKKKTCDYCEDKDHDWDVEKENDQSDKGGSDKANDPAGDDQMQSCGAWEKIVVEPLELNDACGCYTGGMIKYVKGDEVVLVKYDNDACDGKSYKIYCDEGDCESDKAKCCVFYQKCQEPTKAKD